MPDKSSPNLNDDLIREAVKQEIEYIEAPPAGPAWARIESRLEQPRSSIKKRRFSLTWSRAAAVAAACLILTLGGIGIYRTVDFSAPLADLGMAPESADEVGALRTDNDSFEADEPEETVADSDRQVTLAEADPLPPDWPVVLPGDFRLSEELLLVDAGAPEYSGAIYHNDGMTLLLVKSEDPGEDIHTFLNHLDDHLMLELHDLERTNGFIRLTVEDRPGLAWQDNGVNQALLVLFGFIPEEDLEEIAASLD